MPDPEDPRLEEPFDASSEEQVQQRKRDAGRRKKADQQVVKILLATPAGRNWMWNLLGSCHAFHSSFVAGDPCATAYREGERNVALRLLAEITRETPESYVLMLKEQGNG